MQVRHGPATVSDKLVRNATEAMPWEGRFGIDGQRSSEVASQETFPGAGQAHFSARTG